MSFAIHMQPGRTGSVGLSDAVMALGEPEFGAKLFACFRHGIAIDMYSAFVISGGQMVQLAFAGGTCSRQDHFAITASERYADTFWQADPLLRLLLSSNSTPGVPRTQRWKSIPRGEYRDYCYERPGVVDRLSIYQQIEHRSAVLNFYRYEKSGYFSAPEIDGLQQWPRVLPALVIKHVLLQKERVRPALHPPIGILSKRIRSLQDKLSNRECEVCAGLLVGMPLKEISRRIGVEVSTAVTYKKRAYEKIGVTSRQELQAYYQLTSSKVSDL